MIDSESGRLALVDWLAKSQARLQEVKTRSISYYDGTIPTSEESVTAITRHISRINELSSLLISLSLNAIGLLFVGGNIEVVDEKIQEITVEIDGHTDELCLLVGIPNRLS